MKVTPIVLQLLMVCLSIATYHGTLVAQTVIHCPNTTQTLDLRWKWALTEADNRSLEPPFWIGYSFSKLMEKNSYTGSFYSDYRKNQPSLCEVLQIQPCVPEQPVRHMGRHETVSGNVTINDNKHNEALVLKDIGVLFEIDEHTNGHETFGDIKMSNLSLVVDLNDRPVIWLGPTDDSTSVAFLESKFNDREPEEIQKQIISAVGLHPTSTRSISFLSRVLKKADGTEVRKDAAFWLGQTDSDEGLDVLADAAQHDESHEVMESAVFAISQMNIEASTDTLISLARNGNNDDLRKKAMFWLGQKASKKAVSTLEDIASDNDNEEIQKDAVFALTQLPDYQSTDALIKLAKTHANPEVRKSAIFWLGQSDDKRALEALVEIIRQ